MSGKKTTRWLGYWVGGIIGLFLGILGNLIAAWILEDFLKNQFLPVGLLVILLLTIVGIVISVIIQYRQTHEDAEPAQHSGKVNVKNVKAEGSTIDISGNGVDVQDVDSQDSTIKIVSQE